MTSVDLRARPRVTGPYATFVTRVVRTTRLTPRMARVALGGVGLEHFVPVGPDTFVYVLLPPRGESRLTIDGSFTWELYKELPETRLPS